jgi:hypothetical protein
MEMSPFLLRSRYVSLFSKHPQYVFFTRSQGRSIQNEEASALVSRIIIFVDERRSATLAEFREVCVVELVGCNEVSGVMKRNINSGCYN